MVEKTEEIKLDTKEEALAKEILKEEKKRSSMPWAEKYRGKKFEDLKGQDFAIDKLRMFVRCFPKKKGVILHGPAGTGKTSLAYALAAEMNAEIIEMNASDLRNKDQVTKIIRPASLQQSLFKKNKIILVDEVDGISARADFGGLSELLTILDKSQFPVVITANDIWDKKFALLRQSSDLVQLKEVEYRSLAEILKKICDKEKIQINNDVLVSIAIKARGDVRAAINDLQNLSLLPESNLVKEIGERNKELSIFNALQHIFKNSKIDFKMLDIYDEVDMNVDEIFLWVDENIPLEYQGEELAKAYEALSRADVFKGRIHRQQHWRFLVYEHFFLGAGIAGVKKYNRTGFTNYKKPTRILKIWLKNQRDAKKKTICNKYARECHISIKKAEKEFLLIRHILKNPKVRAGLKLTEEENEYLDKPMGL